jgi:long-chain acyl-CoA synthetase
LLLKNHNKTALIWRDTHISYNDLLQYSDDYAIQYQKDLAQKVVIFLENGLEWAYAFYSAVRNKATVVTIDQQSSADEVAYILNDCKAEVLFYSDSTHHVIHEALHSLTYRPKMINVNKTETSKSQRNVSEIAEPSPESTFLIIYTSGTTGSPKGVMLSYDNVLANLEALTDKDSYFSNTDKVMVLLPLHHIFPLLGSLVVPLYNGCTAVFSPSLLSEDIIKTLQDNEISMIMGVPRFYDLIYKGIMGKINASAIAKIFYKLASILKWQAFSKAVFKKVHKGFGGKIKYMICGGAKLNPATGNGFKTLGFKIAEGYGMTETAPMISFPPPNKIKIGTTGIPLKTCEVKTVDGEIVVKGRNVMQGYLNKPEQTAEILIDGWLHTGDLGHIDKEGYLKITGRKKEIIVLSNGKNIDPLEIENKISSMTPYVSEIGVFEKNDQLQAAIFPNFAELRKNGVNNIEETIRWDVIDTYNQKSASYKRILSFFIIKEELPKTRLSKIQRFKLPSLKENTTVENNPIEDPDFEEYRIIKSYLQNQTSNIIFPEAHFELDLGLDSLDLVSFQTFLSSTFGVEIKDDLLLGNPTVLKMSQYMKEKKQHFKIEVVKWAEIFKEKIDLKLPKGWFLQNATKNLSGFILRTFFRIKANGVKNLPKGPVILAPNHQSFLDAFLVMTFFKKKFLKNTFFYAKEKHVRNRFIKFLANRNNVIVMDINKELKQSLQKMATVLNTGRNLVIFPEGTRSKDGNMGSFKKAFAILSAELNVPIIPVAIDGAFEVFPRGKFFPRLFKKISIDFLEPILPNGANYDELSNQVKTSINYSLTQ